jgi:hypothetical protein
MNLEEKFNTIGNRNTFLKNAYRRAKAETLEDFWNDFIVPRLPQKDVVIAWHKLLKDYVQKEGAVYAIRCFNENNEEKIRRGFYTKVNNGDYSFFFTDNSFAYFFERIALDGDCIPTSVDELFELFVERKIPYKLIIRGNKENEEKFANAFPRSRKNPLITQNYKLAHIYPDGERFKLSSNDIVSVSDMTGRNLFSRGRHNQWNDVDGIYIRNLTIDNAQKVRAKKWLIAHFLRFIHPMNYFLAPQAPKTKKIGNIKIRYIYNMFQPNDGRKPNDIGEYEPLLSFIKSKFLELYQDGDKNYYQEFVDLILPVDRPRRTTTNETINLTYSSSPINVAAPAQVVRPRTQRARQQNTNAVDHNKVRNRIAGWASKTDSKVHKILKAFFAVCRNGKALVNDVEQKCSNARHQVFYIGDNNFINSLRSLKTDAGNSYGKVFEQSGDYIKICEEARAIIEEYRDCFS